MVERFPGFVNPQFKTLLTIAGNNVKTILEEETVAPLLFDELHADLFLAWLPTLKKANNEPLSYSALNTHRASLSHLFEAYGFKMKDTFKEEVSCFSKGLQRSLAKKGQKGEVKVKVGKDALPFEVYKNSRI